MLAVASFDLPSQHLTARSNLAESFSVPSHLKVRYKRLVKHTQGICEQVRNVESGAFAEIESAVVIKLSNPKDETEDTNEMNSSTSMGQISASHLSTLPV